MIKIPDIIQLNDWAPIKFVSAMAAIHLSMLGAIGLGIIGLDIPILRQIIGFVYLTFIPGIIILRLFRVHNLGVSVTILFSTGLSVSFLMFSGLFLNSMFSFLNIKSPLTSWNVVIFMFTLLILLSIFSYKTDKSDKNELKYLKISRPALFLILLPILSIIGTYFVNFHNNNILLFILIVLIALIPVLVFFKKIPCELYPLAVVVIAVSLLFHYSLISMYIMGSDIFTEYYVYKQVIFNAYWNPQMFGNVAAMLSIGILPAIYSNFLQIDGAWVFKIVYPIIFSLVPLGLYCVYRLQLKNDDIAFYSVFFFMSLYVFFTEMLSLARQQIAEFFFVLLMYLMIQDTLDKNIRNILLLVFGASMITSHYGLSYIYLVFIIIIFLFSMDMIRTLKIGGLKVSEFNLEKRTMKFFVEFFIVFLLLWYMNISGSSPFNTIVKIGDNLYASIFTDFLNTGTQDRNLQMALGIADPLISSFGRQIHRNLQIITQLFIIIGFFKLIIYREYAKLKSEYFYLIIASFVFLFISLLPNLADKFNMSRIYHITLFALSPLLIIGGIFLIERSIKIIKIKYKLNQDIVFLILILGIMIPYLLFNTGFVYEITKDKSTSIPLGMDRMKNDTITKFDIYSIYTQEQDVYSARWYYKYNDGNKRIYADKDSQAHVLHSYGMISQYKINRLFIKGDNRERGLPENYYVYMNKLNVCEDTFVLRNTLIVNSSSVSLSNKLFNIYSNGCGEIYRK